MSYAACLAAEISMKAKSLVEMLKRKPKRIDGDFPLGIRHGGLIKFSEVLQISVPAQFNVSAELAKQCELQQDFINIINSQVKFPTEYVSVEAFSKFERDGLLWYRFYLSKESGFIQVIVEPDGKTVIEGGIQFFSLLKEEYPSDWDIWTPNPDPESQQRQGNWWIGLSVHPLKGLDLDDEGQWAIWSYQRQWSQTFGQLVKPEIIREEVHLNPFVLNEGGEVMVVSHECMQYARFTPRTILERRQGSADDPVEYLMLTASTHSGGKSVEHWVGVTLSSGDFEVV